ncbi:MAG TPA: GNAT family N-acetyltransferase [Anaerolineaceae bacterium]|nr:GNAT family N-acetyltransferase [Anaerolineaceae bacterium]HPN52424.1 GNAT family N-acetyltransferase [Anaerolineaceae bacterium]
MDKIIIKDLGDGLILRRSNQGDTDALAAFNGKIHPDNEAERMPIEDWTRDLMEGENPGFNPDGFTIVEDKASGQIVSAMCLINQTWTYEGIPFGVGRPELVGTLPQYRRRGLVREQFKVIHEWSEQQGDLAQAITGIPYYYRQFGYEMAVYLDAGRFCSLPAPVEEEVFELRKATEADVPFMALCYENGHQRGVLNCLWNEAQWKHELKKRPKNINRRDLFIIQRKTGEQMGYIAAAPTLWGSDVVVITSFELKPKVSWWEVTPFIARALGKLGETFAASENSEHGASGGKTVQSIGFVLGEEHPAYQIYGYRMRKKASYNWYLRVPDMIKFLTRISPVLEKRLADSICINYTGELITHFYRSGIRWTFEQGKITNLEPWQGEWHAAGACFPDLTFLQLVFGYRNLADLEDMFADCWAHNEKAMPLINSLFQKKASYLWPIS